MTDNLKIGTKLQLSNFALIITVLVVTALSFQFLSSRYLVNEARRQMKDDAESIIQTLNKVQRLSDQSVAERMAGRKELRLTGQVLYSKIVVFDSANRIVYTNVSTDDIKMLKQLDQQDNSDYLAVRRPIVAVDGVKKGRILLAAKIKDVSSLNRLLQGAQFVSIVIGGAFALGMGFLLGRSISKPIRSLAAGMRRFSPKKELPEIAVHSRDEIGELADSFIDMANKLCANDRMQTDFLQNASHELKTPLMAIQGNAEAIKDGIVQGREAEESLDVIIDECQRLKAVVDELIYLTKLDHVTETFRFDEIPIGQVIAEAVTAVQGLAEQKRIRVAVTGDVDAAGMFDREKLKRAFINIVGNGIRYAESNIVLNAVRSGNHMEISCTDDGKGFLPGEEARIFDRFYKGANGGTGIGLAITKAIVEAHGGSIEAFHGKKAGAVIRMTLPLRRSV
ncbi:HAMP domain-containing histidine kinase [Paenibacillus alkaliterrae]|uniref:sensor histidine kinase n=1 Tax=Paenibacillus alkaliterrae TaxID=320909 RepID=UPI001F17BC8F|nr:HAMP domain-containing sensor histidine kinase [Paenibacillus alkaliterrae]MCF2938157.1 HAMP domain-containing histidine kinase [Paenibacillus alkaliterrae]